MIKLVVTDLDGTLLDNNSKISDTNLQTIKYLVNCGIVVVFATGRSLFSAKKVLHPGLPLDYLIFSSGAGILNWKTNELVYSNVLDSFVVEQLIDLFKFHNLTFSVFKPIPDNHYYSFYIGDLSQSPDFNHRNLLYQAFATPLNGFFGGATQFLLSFNNSYNQVENLLQVISTQISDLSIVRATSPIDHTSVWIEIFSKFVSKQKGLEWLCLKLGITSEAIIGIGNDYNDLDFLHWVKYGYMVKNAPAEIRAGLLETDYNYLDGFTKAVKNHIK